MKIRTEQVIDVQEWDKLVEETYQRRYSFQQQNGCQERGSFYLTVPAPDDDFKNDTLPEIVNHKEMGVSFEAWLKRDPKQFLNDQNDSCRKEQWAIDLWWERNFYPTIQMVANDLHKKGLLQAGKYTIDIDW